MTDHSAVAVPPAASRHRTVDTEPPRSPALRAAAEAVGSFLVILAGLGATITASDTALQPTVVFGFAVIAAMIAFGHVSGGHFNPAITLGSLVAGRTGAKDAAFYLVAQVLGAVAASALVWLVLSANPQLADIRAFFSAASNGFDAHSPVQFPLASAFLLEIVATALLVAVFLGAGSARARRDLAPFAVGLTYAGLLTFLLPVDNGGLNPARSTAAAVFAEPWALEQLWLFWAAPVVGALIAGLAYRSVTSQGEKRAAAGPGGDPAPERFDTREGTDAQEGTDARDVAEPRTVDDAPSRTRSRSATADDAASSFADSAGESKR